MTAAQKLNEGSEENPSQGFEKYLHPWGYEQLGRSLKNAGKIKETESGITAYNYVTLLWAKTDG
jgi:hypothetical protein